MLGRKRKKDEKLFRPFLHLDLTSFRQVKILHPGEFCNSKIKSGWAKVLPGEEMQG